MKRIYVIILLSICITACNKSNKQPVTNASEIETQATGPEYEIDLVNQKIIVR